VQPGDAFAQFIIGLNLTHSKKTDEAITPLKEALRLDPVERRTAYLNVLVLHIILMAIIQVPPQLLSVI